MKMSAFHFVGVCSHRGRVNSSAISSLVTGCAFVVCVYYARRFLGNMSWITQHMYIIYVLHLMLIDIAEHLEKTKR